MAGSWFRVSDYSSLSVSDAQGNHTLAPDFACAKDALIRLMNKLLFTLILMLTPMFASAEFVPARYCCFPAAFLDVSLASRQSDKLKEC